MPLGAYILAMPYTDLFDIEYSTKPSLVTRLWTRLFEGRQQQADSIVENELNKG